MFGYCFISSRRRHTRCLSDWSSDVCSSDLATGTLTGITGVFKLQIDLEKAAKAISDPSARSEERRVGKECSAQWRQQSYIARKAEDDVEGDVRGTQRTQRNRVTHSTQRSY